MEDWARSFSAWARGADQGLSDGAAAAAAAAAQGQALGLDVQPVRRHLFRCRLPMRSGTPAKWRTVSRSTTARPTAWRCVHGDRHPDDVLHDRHVAVDRWLTLVVLFASIDFLVLTLRARRRRDALADARIRPLLASALPAGKASARQGLRAESDFFAKVAGHRRPSTRKTSPSRICISLIPKFVLR